MAHPFTQYEAFTDLARAFCAAIEDSSLQGKQGLRELHMLLIKVHAAAMELPEVTCDGKLNRTISHEERRKTYEDLQTRMPLDVYWDTFDPLTEPPDGLVAGSLADDLTDIWRDLKEGLLEVAAEEGNRLAEVWWEWQFSFFTHWGAHSADALRVMYYALRDSY